MHHQTNLQQYEVGKLVWSGFGLVFITPHNMSIYTYADLTSVSVGL